MRYQKRLSSSSFMRKFFIYLVYFFPLGTFNNKLLLKHQAKLKQDLFRSGPDSAPRNSLAEILPLKRGEIRQLKFDLAHYDACKLPSDTFYVKKY